jgi:PIN domain nuclease of toxin-antitoxin system
LRLLLDTHALIWGLGDDPALSWAARDAIGLPNNDALVSAASAMEVVTKHRLGKRPQAAVLARDFEAIVRAEGFLSLLISLRHAHPERGLQIAHKDPFDRLLIAQALVEDLLLGSNERLFDGFGVARLW